MPAQLLHIPLPHLTDLADSARCSPPKGTSAGAGDEMAASSGVQTTGGPVDNGRETRDSGYPNLSWLLTPVRNPRTRAAERYYEAYARIRRVIKRTFGLLKARFRCLRMTGGSLYYSPKKVCQIIVACCMLHNLALRCQVPFLQEGGPEGGLVAAVEPVDSEEEEAEEENIDNTTTLSSNTSSETQVRRCHCLTHLILLFELALVCQFHPVYGP
ncbi:hypothetical protein NDU88_001466 [Pleurodeles waltl]|uniref:DDE Tnp4 domain-containing protein n=1 Tax=Pleurodeles waltl TaxID=8319 RepID=A0AAV7W019_PLEWA|nr:hypothetical protein NDU88_001466 [Pleurodeles waltl]